MKEKEQWKIDLEKEMENFDFRPNSDEKYTKSFVVYPDHDPWFDDLCFEDVYNMFEEIVLIYADVEQGYDNNDRRVPCYRGRIYGYVRNSFVDNAIPNRKERFIDMYFYKAEKEEFDKLLEAYRKNDNLKHKRYELKLEDDYIKNSVIYSPHFSEELSKKNELKISEPLYFSKDAGTFLISADELDEKTAQFNELNKK